MQPCLGIILYILYIMCSSYSHTTEVVSISFGMFTAKFEKDDNHFSHVVEASISCKLDSYYTPLLCVCVF